MIRRSGSVGDLGGQPPRSTRPAKPQGLVPWEHLRVSPTIAFVYLKWEVRRGFSGRGPCLSHLIPARKCYSRTGSWNR